MGFVQVENCNFLPWEMKLSKLRRMNSKTTALVLRLGLPSSPMSNPSQKRSFSRTLFKRNECENTGLRFGRKTF